MLSCHAKQLKFDYRSPELYAFLCRPREPGLWLLWEVSEYLLHFGNSRSIQWCSSHGYCGTFGGIHRQKLQRSPLSMARTRRCRLHWCGSINSLVVIVSLKLLRLTTNWKTSDDKFNSPPFSQSCRPCRLYKYRVYYLLVLANYEGISLPIWLEPPLLSGAFVCLLRSGISTTLHEF